MELHRKIQGDKNGLYTFRTGFNHMAGVAVVKQRRSVLRHGF